MPTERVLYTDHPRMFRNNPIRFVVMSMLAPVGIGLLMLLTWWWRCMGRTLTVTNEKTSLRKGIFSRDLNEVQHTSVRNVILKQSFFQRLFNMGSLGISSAGQSGVEIYAYGIHNPMAVKRLIESKGQGEPIQTGPAIDFLAVGIFAVTAFVSGAVWWGLISAFVNLMVTSYKGL